MVIEDVVDKEWQNAISDWLVQSGCLYMIAWGLDCSRWDDSVDWANLAEFDYGEIPEDSFVMTTWHENEPLAEAFWFAGQCACHPTVELTHTLIVHIASQERENGLLSAYRQAQKMD